MWRIEYFKKGEKDRYINRAVQSIMHGHERVHFWDTV